MILNFRGTLQPSEPERGDTWWDPETETTWLWEDDTWLRISFPSDRTPLKPYVIQEEP